MLEKYSLNNSDIFWLSLTSPEPEYMNIHPPPPPTNALATALNAVQNRNSVLYLQLIRISLYYKLNFSEMIRISPMRTSLNKTCFINHRDSPLLCIRSTAVHVYKKLNPLKFE